MYEVKYSCFLEIIFYSCLLMLHDNRSVCSSSNLQVCFSVDSLLEMWVTLGPVSSNKCQDKNEIFLYAS